MVESPLGQPRNTFFGTLVSSFLGICITKLFMLNQNNEQYLWIAGALCVGVASIAMSVTKTVHPPGGAAALLCAIDNDVRAMGWFYLVVQIVSGLEILAVACLFNNIQRRYPLYWWTPTSLQASGSPTAEPKIGNNGAGLQPKAGVPKKADEHALSRLATLESVLSDRHVVGTTPNDTGDLNAQDLKNVTAMENGNINNLVLILPTHYALPKGLELTEEEEALLVNIQNQLKNAAALASQKAASGNIV